ncbi:hypothetical protein [Snodgrassella alvi]|jgi:hypothetical protein|uniref:hypothetical protein n=1 Tax=Snodgrassella alvi TaxID=1196083 RepID=UPI000C1E8F45|nr:hypothetical protein [Snodgrassella alvi]PIT14626.1 hypothetical protein BGI30_03070 [Snodgrassella alvi]PIT28480.1 hypothetical protein BGI37_02640 [Snodgrassella alvi]PIT57515.1 hypothetical protein BHC59_03690 [Snodgrassella alvi]
MVKEYTGAAFLRRVICSLSTLIISAWPMLLALFADGGKMPILKLVKVFTDNITLNINDIIFIMAFFAILILLIMITGWIFNISSNLFLKILVIIGCICGIPNTIISLILFIGGGFLILPAAILAVYLTHWYLKGGGDYPMHPKPRIILKIKA